MITWAEVQVPHYSFSESVKSGKLALCTNLFLTHSGSLWVFPSQLGRPVAPSSNGLKMWTMRIAEWFMGGITEDQTAPVGLVPAVDFGKNTQ